jgi:hypothetical protein
VDCCRRSHLPTVNRILATLFGQIILDFRFNKYKVLPSHNSSKPRLRIWSYPDESVAVASPGRKYRKFIVGGWVCLAIPLLSSFPLESTLLVEVLHTFINIV